MVKYTNSGFLGKLSSNQFSNENHVLRLGIKRNWYDPKGLIKKNKFIKKSKNNELFNNVQKQQEQNPERDYGLAIRSKQNNKRATTSTNASESQAFIRSFINVLRLKFFQDQQENKKQSIKNIKTPPTVNSKRQQKIKANRQRNKEKRDKQRIERIEQRKQKQRESQKK